MIFCLAFYLILLSIGLWFGLNFLISSQISFFCTLLVLICNFYTYKSKINSILSSNNFDFDDESCDDFILNDKMQIDKIESNQKIKHKFLPSIVSLFAFFSPLKLISYFIMSICFLILLRNEILNISGFMIGILFCIFCVVFFIKFKIKLNME